MSAHRKTVQFAAIALLVGICAALGAEPSGQSEGRSRELFRYLDSVREIPFSLVARQVYTVTEDKEITVMASGVSPNMRWLHIGTQTRSSNLQTTITLVDLKTTNSVKIHSVERGSVKLNPVDIIFAPDASEAYVLFVYDDAIGGANWIQWDVDATGFSKEGQQEIEQLLHYTPATRPKEIVHPKARPGPPVWSLDGIKYKDRHSARQHGVRVWQMSAFESSSTYGFYLTGDRYYDFLFETLPHKDAYGRSAFRCHIFAEGGLVTTMSSPTRFQPAPILLTYRERELYAYANLGKTKDSTPWRLNLGPVVVDRVIDLTSSAVLNARGALLVIRDLANPVDLQFVMLYTSPGERSKLEHDKE